MVERGFHHQVADAARIHRVIGCINIVVLTVLKEQRHHQRIPKILLVGLIVPNAQRIDDVLARKIVFVRNAAVIQAVHKRSAAAEMTHHHPDDTASSAHRLVDCWLSIRPMSRNHIVGTVLIELVTQRVYRVVTHRDIVTAKQMSTEELPFFRLIRQRKRQT